MFDGWFSGSTPQSPRGSTAGTGVMPNTAHACTPAKLLSGIVPASRGPNPGKYIGFDSVHPDCKMEQWPMGSVFRERLRGRSMFLIGDCWERRLIEHVCKGKVIAKYDEHEPFAFSCEVMPNVTIGHLHIGGVGELHSEATAEYMTRRMASMPTQQRVTEMLGRFRRDRLGGRDPTLVLVQSHAHDFAWLAETTRGTVAEAELQQSPQQLYAWWGVQQRTFLPRWIRDVEQVTTAIGLEAPGSHVYWNTRNVPLVEYAQKTVGKAYNRTTPNFPIAFHAMNELVRSHVESKVAQALVRSHHGRWQPHVGLLDMARYGAGSDALFFADGLHQKDWVSKSFAEILLNLLALLPLKGGS